MIHATHFIRKIIMIYCTMYLNVIIHSQYYISTHDIPIIRSLGSNLAGKMSESRQREMRAGRIIIDRKHINKGLNAKRLFSLRTADDGGGWAASS